MLLPGKFHGQRRLVDYSPWGHKESDTTEQLTLFTLCILKGEADLPSEEQSLVWVYSFLTSFLRQSFHLLRLNFIIKQRALSSLIYVESKTRQTQRNSVEWSVGLEVGKQGGVAPRVQTTSYKMNRSGDQCTAWWLQLTLYPRLSWLL